MTHVAIIGGGLAGTACAYVLGQYGVETTIYEARKKLASGASGNSVGLYNPRLSVHRTPESDFYSSAFSQAIEVFKGLEDIDYNPCGALHLLADEKQKRRFPQCFENWNWPKEKMQLLDAGEASLIAGVTLDHSAIFLPEAGCVSPRKLCERYADEAESCCGVSVRRLSDTPADAVIVACGYGALGFEETSWLPLKQVRGQITQVKASPHSRKLKTNLCYSGFISAAAGDHHVVGATFQPWLDHSDILLEDNDDNIANLAQAVPSLAEGLEVTAQRASLRTSSRDHFPIVGEVPGHNNLYVSVAHGSYGIVGSIAAANLIADMILGRPLSQSEATRSLLNPERFL